jgi:hypothetical protein
VDWTVVLDVGDDAVCGSGSNNPPDTRSNPTDTMVVAANIMNHHHLLTLSVLPLTSTLRLFVFVSVVVVVVVIVVL